MEPQTFYEPVNRGFEAKVAELVGFGARVDQPVEEIDGVWTAVLDEPR